MLFDQLIDRPNPHTLNAVLNGDKLDLIAPFARKGPLGKILPTLHEQVRIITRFPIGPLGSVKRLDNYPRDFLDLMDRMGDKVKIFALPAVHTKLYLNGTDAFFGSANFTSTGFGASPEALLKASDVVTYQQFSALFKTYLTQSTKVNVARLNSLQARLDAGKAKITAAPEFPITLHANPSADDEGAFRSWLATLPDDDADYIEARFDSGRGYNMTGHTQSALPGIRAFLRENLDLIPVLAAEEYEQHQFWKRNPEVIQRFKDFVIAKGSLYPANGGGAWKNKLPPFLCGSGKSGGGKGSGLIARMLIYLSQYAIERGF